MAPNQFTTSEKSRNLISDPSENKCQESSKKKQKMSLMKPSIRVPARPAPSGKLKRTRLLSKLIINSQIIIIHK